MPRTVRSVSRREDGGHTLVTLDLGFRNVPVDELRIAAATERYERPVEILGSNDGPIPVGAHHRYIRLEIDNGDDGPLHGIEVSAWSNSRALLLEGGHPPPYAVYYGDPRATAPQL